MLVVISNMLKRYSFQIPVLYVQQLYSCCYLERLLIIGLILSCQCYCFIIGPTDSIDYYFLRYVRSFVRLVSDLSCYSHVVRVRLSDFRFRSILPILRSIAITHVVRVCLSDFQFVRLSDFQFVRATCFRFILLFTRCQSAIE